MILVRGLCEGASKRRQPRVVLNFLISLVLLGGIVALIAVVLSSLSTVQDNRIKVESTGRSQVRLRSSQFIWLPSPNSCCTAVYHFLTPLVNPCSGRGADSFNPCPSSGAILATPGPDPTTSDHLRPPLVKLRPRLPQLRPVLVSSGSVTYHLRPPLYRPHPTSVQNNSKRMQDFTYYSRNH